MGLAPKQQNRAKVMGCELLSASWTVATSFLPADPPVAVRKHVAMWRSLVCQGTKSGLQMPSAGNRGQLLASSQQEAEGLDAANTPMSLEAQSSPLKLSDETLADAMITAGSVL